MNCKAKDNEKDKIIRNAKIEKLVSLDRCSKNLTPMHKALTGIDILYRQLGKHVQIFRGFINDYHHTRSS